MTHVGSSRVKIDSFFYGFVCRLCSHESLSQNLNSKVLELKCLARSFWSLIILRKGFYRLRARKRRHHTRDENSMLLLSSPGWKWKLRNCCTKPAALTFPRRKEMHRGNVRKSIKFRNLGQRLERENIFHFQSSEKCLSAGIWFNDHLQLFSNFRHSLRDILMEIFIFAIFNVRMASHVRKRWSSHPALADCKWN